jgi:D-tyrosyl-tRNA(Tyr) deacylase
MRALIQRVSQAAVRVDAAVVGAIENGLLVLAGFEAADTREDVDWMAAKLVNLRIFNDAQQVPNLSVLETGGNILLVSQFTLHAATKKGNRPSYIRASKPEHAIPLYEYTIRRLNELLPQPVQTGRFGADMQVSLINDGPVTIWIDSRQKE